MAIAWPLLTIVCRFAIAAVAGDFALGSRRGPRDGNGGARVGSSALQAASLVAVVMKLSRRVSSLCGACRLVLAQGRLRCGNARSVKWLTWAVRAVAMT